MAIYVSFSLAYLLLSDWVVANYARSDPTTHMALSFAKGSVFIVLTAVILYILIFRGRKSLQSSLDSLRRTEAKASEHEQRSQAMERRSATLESDMQGLLGRLEVGVFQLDRSGRIIAGNRAFFRMLQDQVGGALGHDFFSLIQPEAVARSVRAEVLSTARLSQNELQLRTLQGSIITVSLSGGMGRKDSGEEVIEGLVEDVSERKRVESDLALANATLEAIIESSPAAILVMGAEGKVQTWNASAERLLSLPRTDVIGQRLPLRLLADGGEKDLMQLLSEGERVMDRETEVEAKDGGKVSISLSAALLHEPLMEPAGAVAVILDITDRKAAEEERARAYDQIGRNIEQFAVLADSIRNPLTVIVGRADMGDGEDMRIIAQQAERIESIIKRLDEGWIESEKVRQLLKKGV